MTKKKSSCHAVYWLQFHLILVCKYRRPYLNGFTMPIITEAIQQKLKEHGIEVVEANGEADHLHLLINATPSSRLDIAIGQAKGFSSYCVRKESFSFKIEKAFWSSSYGLFSVGANEEIIKKYIENQGKKEDVR